MVACGQENPEEPFDGVRPHDFPLTYSIFLERRCFRQRDDVAAFIDVNDYTAVLCITCFAREAQNITGLIRINRGLHETGRAEYLPLFCGSCFQILQIVRPIEECGVCTRFLIAYLPPQ